MYVSSSNAKAVRRLVKPCNLPSHTGPEEPMFEEKLFFAAENDDHYTTQTPNHSASWTDTLTDYWPIY